MSAAHWSCQSKSDANVWKSHLRWELLERNLGPLETVKLDELQLVRRWLFSNRKGLESPFFARSERLRINTSTQCLHRSMPICGGRSSRKWTLRDGSAIQLTNEPTDVNAAALGRTLAWFDQTRQLTEEVGALRELAFTAQRSDCLQRLANRPHCGDRGERGY